jgi:hypothetical protein
MYRFGLTAGIWAARVIQIVLWPVAWMENETHNIRIALWNKRVDFDAR